MRVIPKHSVDATGSHVERSTSASIDVGEGATGVVTGRTLALSREGVSEEAFVRRAVRALVLGCDIGVHPANASGAGMESVLVERVGVDVFDDVNLRGKIEIKMLVWIRRENSNYLSTVWPFRAIS